LNDGTATVDRFSAANDAPAVGSASIPYAEDAGFADVAERLGMPKPIACLHHRSATRTSIRMMTFEEMEQVLRQRLQALPPAERAKLLHIMRLPADIREEAIREFSGHPKTREFGELLKYLEEDRAARAVVFGLLAEMERKGRR
jgi:hypothetical protein